EKLDTRRPHSDGCEAVRGRTVRQHELPDFALERRLRRDENLRQRLREIRPPLRVQSHLRVEHHPQLVGQRRDFLPVLQTARLLGGRIVGHSFTRQGFLRLPSSIRSLSARTDSVFYP